MSDPADIKAHLGSAERFLALLDPLGQFTFQTFDDSKAKRRELAKVLHGTLAQRGKLLKQLNDDGAGVFVTVNATDLKGRKEANITAVRALFVDLDGAPIQPVREGPLEPHLQVESSPGRWHAYWLVRDVALAQFRPLQRGLIARFQGDPAVIDLPRVMRIPGFVHRKNAPMLSRLASATGREPYTLAEVLAAFGWASAEAADPEHAKARAAQVRVPLAPSGDDDLIDDLVEALGFIPADGYEEWKKVAFALKTLGARGEPLFHDWASRSAKYDAQDSAKHWANVQPSKTSHQAVFKLAQQFGWDAANSPSQKRKREARGRAGHREQGPIAPMPPDEAYDGPQGLASHEGEGEDEDGDEQPAPLIELPPEPPKTLQECLARFELVYGGNKVWDTATNVDITYFSFAAMVGKDLAKAWQADTSKRVRVPGTGAKGPKKEKKKPKGDPTKLAMLLERYVLIYGTEAAFDREEHLELTLGSLRAYAGLAAVRAWTDHPHRKVMSLKQVVFNPRIAPDDPTCCNLYKGWPTEASPGDSADQELCRRWRAVVNYAVNGDAAVFDWLMKWMAYQVRYPGSKMKTSVIMHGNEGSGKNTIWDAFRRIFGDYGRSITQTQLELPQTDWISCKFFIIGNEVLHKQEQVQQKGRLKTLITEDQVSIERKFLPGREEPNYCNLVFLSNEKMPLSLDPGDRRFLVIWTPPPHPDGPAFYKGLSQDEMPDSTVSAIYHWLLNEVDLTDFGPHTKPPMTKAKAELIDASLASAPRFMREWMAGELEVPYISCKTLSLYAAYLYWCRIVGERYPWPENRFGADAKKLVEYGKKRHTVEGPVRQSMFYIVKPETRPPQQSEAMWLAISQDEFERRLGEWKGERDQ